MRATGAGSLCLQLGTTRSVRQPYSLLAQLGVCLAGQRLPDRASNDSVRIAMLRGQLNIGEESSAEPKGALIKSLHRLRNLRAMLPEHRTDCGFWSNCTGNTAAAERPGPSLGSGGWGPGRLEVVEQCRAERGEGRTGRLGWAAEGLRQEVISEI